MGGRFGSENSRSHSTKDFKPLLEVTLGALRVIIKALVSACATGKVKIVFKRGTQGIILNM